MTSPNSDVITKRRYHRHRKTKKKTSLSKEALGKGIPPPKISKRLTSGFGFKGAVFTSSHSRNAKGDGDGVKSKKNSADYDLHCLLKAAKRKVVADKSQSSSTGMSSAEDIDDPFNPIEHYPDEGDKYVNYKRKPLQQPAKEVYNTGTSSEDSEDQDFERTMQVLKVPMKKQASFDHAYKENQNCSSVKDRNADVTNSSGNSTTHAKLKPHISSYQKFAVGVVEALVLEKKKQFPNLELSKQIKLELNEIYRKKKNADDIAKKATNICLQTPQCNNLEVCGSEPKVQPVPQTRLQLNPGMPDNKYKIGQKSFKERTVEAWVEAIPKDLTDNNAMLDKFQATKSQSERSDVQFERDFLLNIKKEHTKPTNPYSLKKEISPLVIMNDIKSPAFSPFLANEKIVFPGLKALPQNNESQRKKITGMNSNFHFPLEKDQVYQNPPRAQQSWTSWFKGNDKVADQRQPDSPMYPSPLFTFDPPGSKRSWMAMKECLGTNTNTNHMAKNVENKLTVWSQFPKLVKNEDKEVSKLRGIHYQKENAPTHNKNNSYFQQYDKPIRFERSVNTQRPESPMHIQFAPRKMF